MILDGMGWEARSGISRLPGLSSAPLKTDAKA
jgi:hypothetical protein